MQHINKLAFTHHTIKVLLGTMLFFTTGCKKYDNRAFDHDIKNQERNAKIASKRMAKELRKSRDVSTPEDMVWLWKKQFVVGSQKPTAPPKENQELERLIERLRNANPADAKELQQRIRNLKLRDFSRKQSEAYHNQEARKELSKLLKKNAAKIARKHRRASFWGKILPSRLFRTRRKAKISDNEALILTEENVKEAWKKIQREHGVAKSPISIKPKVYICPELFKPSKCDDRRRKGSDSDKSTGSN